MAHTSSKRGNRHHKMLVPIACPYAWEEGDLEWHSSSVHTNFRYFEDLSWKAATRAPKQWARHKRKGVGPLDLKRSLDHWYTADEGSPELAQQNGQALIGSEQLRTHIEMLQFELNFV